MSEPAVASSGDWLDEPRLFCGSRRGSLSRSDGTVYLSCHSASSVAGDGSPRGTPPEQLGRPRSAPDRPTSSTSARMASLLPRLKVRSFLEDFSDIDPSKFHFYDFGIQDFLVMRQHITLDEDNDVSSNGGDYNQGLTIDPCAYLSDSEVSTGSVDLSAEQVMWEKRLVEGPTGLLKNQLRHASYKKSNSSHEVRRARRGSRPLRRRASDNLFTQATVASPLARLATNAVSWSSDADNVLPTDASELEIGEDCGSGSSLDSQTVGRASYHQSDPLPPVVTDSERPVQCSASAEERCHRSQPCLTHALVQAGLSGGGRAGRRHLPTAHSGHAHSQHGPGQTTAPGTAEPGHTTAPGTADPGQTTASDTTEPGQKGTPDITEPGHTAGVSGSTPARDDKRLTRRNSHASNASFTSVSHLSDGMDAMADLVDEPQQMTALERKLIMKKHPMLRNDTNAHILAPADFRIGMK